MYLSRLILDPRSRQVQRELADPVEMHRTILRAFGATRQEAGALFRVDVERATGTPTVLVQSHMAPDWAFLDELTRYLLPAEDPNPACKQFDPALSAGQRLAFRLRANPTVKRDGKRLAWLRTEDQVAWLERKGADHGFAVLTCHAASDGFAHGKKTDDGGARRVTLLTVRFDGILQVTDAGRLREAVATGIGPSKAYGCGLLSLAPAR